MITLIVGTPDSGKSLLAESIATKQADNGKKYYIATMIPFGEEGVKRVEKHRKMREGKGFVTLEWPDNIKERAKEIDLSDATVLLECMSNLVGNEMYSDCNKDLSDVDLIEIITYAISELEKMVKDFIIVTNTFALDDEQYDTDTKRYVSIIAQVNEKLIEMADVVFTCENGVWKENENN